MSNLFVPKVFITIIFNYALAVIRRIAPQEIRPEIEKLRIGLRVFINHCYGSAKIKKILESESILRLELGAGTRRLPGWIGIDMCDSAELQLDLRRPIPIPENRVEAIYSSHFLEHFSYPDPLKNLVWECYRILKPGGYFSAAVPNGRQYVSAYDNGSEIIEPGIREKILPVYLRTRMDELSWFVYMYDQHHYLFDEENLVQLLIDEGFKDVTVREFNPELDIEVRRHESLYVIAYKPIELPGANLSTDSRSR